MQKYNYKIYSLNFKKCRLVNECKNTTTKFTASWAKFIAQMEINCFSINVFQQYFIIKAGWLDFMAY